MDNKKKEIKDIYSYLEAVQIHTDRMTKITGLKHFGYRGENENYETHSIPNLFRGTIFEMYQKIEGFEKNILEEVSSNKLTRHEKNLEIAMDAQHGGFPSRLLDITFNSLSALFFAVTPHYTQNVDRNDDKDGQVIIYAIDKMVTSNSKYINELYDKLITNDIYTQRFDGYFHYFIDYVELNPRIKAQQGGFILFCGNQHVAIPEWKQTVIKIPGEAKPKLRDQLKRFFDITMGSIYPEPSNKVEYLVEKSNVLVQNPDHVNSIIDEIRKNTKWYYNRINYLENIDQTKKRNQLIIELERYITEVNDSLEFYKINKHRDMPDVEVKTKKVKENIHKIFNEIIKEINTEYGQGTLRNID